MTNFIFKSPRGLIKNSPIPDATLGQLKIVQSQCRFLRQDIKDISLKLDKLLIDKHLQMQVDNYFGDDSEKFPETSPQTDSDEQ